MDRPPLRGRELQKGIIDLAHQLGWRVAHFPPISTTRGGKSWWLTPVAADGKGFPDLILVRDRIVIAEVKGDGDTVRPDQRAWLDAFSLAGQSCYIWTPATWLNGEIEHVLRWRRGEPDGPTSPCIPGIIAAGNAA